MENIMTKINYGANVFWSWVSTLSQQTLNISAIIVLHSVFVPATLAYLSGITEKLPNLDSVLLVTLALTIMAINNIIKKDMVAIVVHMSGFIANCVLLSLVVFK